MKPLGSGMVGSAFCHSKVDQKSTKNSLRLGEKLAVSSQWLCNFDTLKGAKGVDLCFYFHRTWQEQLGLCLPKQLNIAYLVSGSNLKVNKYVAAIKRLDIFRDSQLLLVSFVILYFDECHIQSRKSRQRCYIKKS